MLFFVVVVVVFRLSGVKHESAIARSLEGKKSSNNEHPFFRFNFILLIASAYESGPLTRSQSNRKEVKKNPLK